jgi:hypothetical protein
VKWNALGMCAALALGGTGVSVAEQAAEGQYSEANELLFMTDHLERLPEAAILEYEFEKTGKLEEAFRDTVTMTIVGATDSGAKRVEFEFFTGDRQRRFPPVQDARGNPILLLFLQRDASEMQRRTDGSWRHFQRVIKHALAHGARVEPVVVPYDGKDVDAVQISIHPFYRDAQRARYADWNAKYYVFTLSEAVPGWVYQLRSTVPPREGEAEPLLQETFTLRGVREQGT